ncbi:hypothetical protein [Pontibacillus yanchengensis]|nr:hypothetical protein [Pontibacillus yanchengensis]
MVIMTNNELQNIEQNYYYLIEYKKWQPYPKELKSKLLTVYGKEPHPLT